MRILIGDDHRLVRIALRYILQENFPDLQLEEVDNTTSLFKRGVKEKWDLIISDISYPDGSGLEALKQIKSHSPKVPVLILSMHPTEEYAIRCITAGSSGYLMKDKSSEELIVAIKQIMNGRKYLNMEVAELLASYYENKSKSDIHENLSDREYQIFKMLVDGAPMQDISNKLSISINTVRSHKVHILKKMNLHGDAELIKYGLKHNFN